MTNELVSNRRATHDYEIIKTFEAGIELQGTEIKSLRQHGGSLQDAYVKVIENRLLLIGCNIAPYKFGNVHNHEDRRDRKLLMHKREIAELKEASQEKGMTLIPLSIYLKEGKAKIRIGIARGKKTIDKRATIKAREDKRMMQRVLKNNQ